jgi:hypothetical protein
MLYDKLVLEESKWKECDGVGLCPYGQVKPSFCWLYCLNPDKGDYMADVAMGYKEKGDEKCKNQIM